MKKPQIDLTQRQLRAYVADLRFINKTKLYWPTRTVNGVKVFDSKMYHYPTSLWTENNQKFAKLIGAYDDLDGAEWEGIETAWLYFNATKTSDETMSDNILAAAMNEAGSFTGTITITADSSTGQITEIEGSTKATAETGAEITEKYSDLWSKYKITSSFANDGIKSTMLRYALFSEDLSYSIDKIETLYTKEIVKVSEFLNTTTTVYYTNYVLTLTINHDIFSETTDIVASAIADLENTATNFNEERTGIELNNIYHQPVPPEDMYDESDADSSYNYSYTPPSPTNPSLWEYSNRTYYLKFDVLDTSNYFTRSREKVEFLGSVLDSGYQKKKIPWWKKLIAVVVFIVVVVVSCMSGCGAVAFAGAILTASLAVSLLTLAMQAWGDEEGALAGSEFLQQIEPIITIATIVFVVGSIYSAMNKAATEAATAAARQQLGEEATKEAVEKLTSELLNQSFSTYAFEGMWSGFTSMSNTAINYTMKVTTMVMNAYYENKLDDQKDELTAKQAQVDEQMQQEEAMLMRDLAQDFIKMYTNVSDQQKSEYAYTDRPYERVTSRYHIGNIQATTVKALNTDRVV